MEKNKKILIGVSVVLVATAIGAYFYFKDKSKKDELPSVKEGENPKEESANKQSVSDKKTIPVKPKDTVIPYGKKLYSTGDNVNIRLEPSINSKVMAKVNKGQEIGLNIGEIRGGYIGIVHKNSKGEPWWIAKQYVKI